MQLPVVPRRVDQSEHPVLMLLPFAEASLILDMFENGSLPKTAAASTAAEKLRRAVVFAGSDRHAIIQLYCWQAEAELLLRARANAAPGIEPERP